MSALFPPPGVQILSVGDLTRSIKNLLETEHPSVWVEGEVSNLARPSSGHLYLTLKDEEAPLRSVIYRGVALRMRFDLRDGMKVIVRGRISVYTPRGEYQLLIEEVQPKGIGALELAFRQLKEKLSAAGYFDPERKKHLPRIPRRVALVTSPTGSAVRDMLEVFARRWPAVEVWVVPVHVQGEEAAPEIAAAIGFLNRLARTDADHGVDVILLARGGGSLEDLWPFNEELVAHAMVRSTIPIITGIGHEDDLTIADLVADRRALTPTEAAERVVPDRMQLLGTLEETQSRMRMLLMRQLQLTRARLEQMSDRPCFRRPMDRIREREERVDELTTRLHRAGKTQHQRDQQRLESLTGRLEALSPLKVLTRGYSVTRKLEDLTIVRTPEQVQPGDWILTQIHHGQLISQVASATPESQCKGMPPTPKDGMQS